MLLKAVIKNILHHERRIIHLYPCKHDNLGIGVMYHIHVQ